MPIKPQFLVRGADGRPLPPQDLLERIQRFDPRIGLFYTNAAWAITEAWKDDDPRRERIQQGEMQPEFAFDVCGYLPVTCSLDEALPYIERELRNVSAEQFAALRYTVNHWNDVEIGDQQEQAVLGAVSDAMDRSNVVTPGISSAVVADVSGTPVTPIRQSRKERRAAMKAGESGAA